MRIVFKNASLPGSENGEQGISLNDPIGSLKTRAPSFSSTGKESVGIGAISGLDGQCVAVDLPRWADSNL